MKTIQLPPPKRYLIESETDEEGTEYCKVVDVTGIEDPVYIIGQESPWIGVTLDQLEAWAGEGAYAPHTASILEQIADLRRKP